MNSLSFFIKRRPRPQGFSLVEVVIGGALILLMFGGIIGAFQTALALVGQARASSGAIGLANEQIEYIRSLPYDKVGTVSGIPSGNIPQNETLVLNGVSYTRRTLIQYVDAPDDGTGASDSNGITADYKHAKVELTWTVRGSARSVALITNVIPRGIETTAGGGTLVVNVIDASAVPVSGATVHIVNTTGTSSVDITSYANAAGVVMFPGSPAGGGYQITATRSGYSTDQTYSASTTNPNPNPAHVSVVAGGVSTVALAIDRTSTRILRTVAPPSASSTQDMLTDAANLLSSTTVVVTGGEMVLQGAPGTYVAQGRASTTAISPSNIVSWTQVSWTGTVPLQTNLTLHVYTVDVGGVYTRVPDSDLPGNSVGFATSPINLSGLSSATYPRLAIGINLQSFDSSDTPHLIDWSISYMVSDVTIPSVGIVLTGTKNIGTDAGGAPVRKYTRTYTTDTNGLVTVSNLEWDQYTAVASGNTYDVSDVCAASSLLIAPNSFATTTLVLSSHTANSLLVGVFTSARNPISGATVQITSGGAPITRTTSACGYAYFGSLSATGYDITTSATGYATDTLSGAAVGGTTKIGITLSP